MVPHDASIWSADVHNAKPEPFYYARREAAVRGIALRPLWATRRIADGEFPPGTFKVLRREELARYNVHAGPQQVKLDEGTVDGDGCTLVLVRP